MPDKPKPALLLPDRFWMEALRSCIVTLGATKPNPPCSTREFSRASERTRCLLTTTRNRVLRVESASVFEV